MPFDNPYFPQSFDVGTVGGPHTHIDSSGVQVINGTQKIVLAPSSIFNPNAVAINFYTGDAGETEPGFIYEILDVGYWVGQAGNGGDAFRLTLFDSSFAAGPQAAISLRSGSRNGIRGSAGIFTATDRLNGNPTTLLVDGDSQTIQFGIGLAPFNNIGTFDGALFVSVGIGNETLQFYTQAGGVATELFHISNGSNAGHLMSWNGQVFALPVTATESQTWQALPLSNGWVNFGGVHAPASIEQHGPVVRIKGLIKSGNTLNGTVIAAIPAAAMPAESLIWATTTNDAFCTIGIDTGLGGLICRVGVSNVWLAINVTYSVR